MYSYKTFILCNEAFVEVLQSVVQLPTKQQQQEQELVAVSLSPFSLHW